ncbi:hypothetical protein HN865_02360 [Candidatus Woesearchaeota archaeon]|jgi:hypothetical protein|nr:hypothetical protein [Candidatus Woesearchaeota archaeon]MBT7237677.1 hypothetical protein [Candidatus Woesearchaeota archaeon]
MSLVDKLNLMNGQLIRLTPNAKFAPKVGEDRKIIGYVDGYSDNSVTLSNGETIKKDGSAYDMKYFNRPTQIHRNTFDLANYVECEVLEESPKKSE